MAIPGPRPQTDRETALAQSALFRALPVEALRDLALQAVWRQIDAGEAAAPLCRMGDRDAPVLWLLIGEGEALAQVSFAPESARRSRLGYRLLGGELAGDIDLLLAGLALPLSPRAATIRALRPHRALELPAAALVALADSQSTFRRRLIRDAARRLATFLGSDGTGRQHPPDVAFAVALLDLFDDFGGQFDGPHEALAQRLSQQQVADMMGISLRSFSARSTAWAARGLLDSAPLRLADRARVERIAEAASLSPPEALSETRQAAARLIAEGDRLRGAAMAADGLELWPDNPGLLFLIALALARAGDATGAAQVLDHPALRPSGTISDLRDRVQTAWHASLAPTLGDGVEDDPGLRPAELGALCQDIAALQARLAKDRALALAPEAGREPALRAAAAVYAQVDAALPSAFAAVNAASLLALAGDPAAAFRMARRATVLASGAGHWDLATRGEAALILDQPQAALAAYRQAAALAPPGDVAVMRRQLSHLATAGLTGASDCLSALSPGVVLLVSGPVLAAGSAAPPILAKAAEEIESQIAARFQAGGIERLVVSLASGADLVAAELAIRAGAPVDAVLPFPLAEFRRLSVAIGGGRDWEAQLARVLPHLRSLAVLWDGPVPPTQTGAHFARANQVMLGEAMLAAQSQVTTAEVLAIGAPASAAAALADAADALGLAVQRLPPPAGVTPSRHAGPAPASPFAGLVFAHALAPTPRARAWLDREGFAIHPTKSRRLMALRLCPDLQDAAGRVADLAPRAADLGIRLVLDHGPVLRKSVATPQPEAMSRLAAAQAELPALATGVVAVSPVAALALIGLGTPPDRLAEIAFDASAPKAGESGAGFGIRRLFRLC